jgi:hypothetical protein
MKSAMKRAAGGVALTMVLIRGFCGGGVFLGYLGIECLLLSTTSIYYSHSTSFAISATVTRLIAQLREAIIIYWKFISVT